MIQEILLAIAIIALLVCISYVFIIGFVYAWFLYKEAYAAYKEKRYIKKRIKQHRELTKLLDDILESRNLK